MHADRDTINFGKTATLYPDLWLSNTVSPLPLYLFGGNDSGGGGMYV